MSQFGKRGRRCDTCGRITNEASGEYRNRGESRVRYIVPEEDGAGRQHPSRDRCDDCAERKA